MASEAFPAIVGEIYDSIVDENRWPQTLETVCASVDSCLGMIGVVDTVVRAARFAVSWGDPGIVDALVAGHAADVPFYRAIPQMDIDVPYTVDHLYLLQGEGARETWLASPIAQDWVMPNGLDDFFWVSMMKQPTQTATLVLVTDRNRRPIRRADLDHVARLAPHIRRAVTIGNLLDAQRRTADMFRSIVDSLFHPVLVVADNLDIVYANAAAERLLAEGTIAGAQHGRLTFPYTPGRDAVARAIATGRREEAALQATGINVPLALSRAPAVAHVLPLARRDPSARFSSRAVAAIFIGIGGQVPTPAMDAVAALFGFTASETRVAAAVAAGHTRQEIASSNGLSPTTVQTQLGAIFDKTGVGDQRALQALIRDLTPPAKGPDKT